MNKRFLPLLIILSVFIGNILLSSESDETIDVEILKISIGQFFQQNSVGELKSPLRFKNLNEKTIKYMVVKVGAYNAVDDLISDNSFRITGPIKQNQVYKYSGSCGKYYNQVVKYLKVRVKEVEYLDGSINNNPTEYMTHKRNYQDAYKIDMPIALILGYLGYYLFLKE